MYQRYSLIFVIKLPKKRIDMHIIKLNEDVTFGDKPIITPMGESGFCKEIRIALAKGVQMKEHSAPAAIAIELFSGVMELQSGSETQVMQAGDIALFDAKVPHSLHALEDAIVRLSLSKSDSIQRVQNLVLKQN